MLSELYSSNSITAAAQRLFISQPALTKWLHKIEEDLGIIIVNRSVKGIVFTLEGKHLVRYGELALENYKKELKELQGIHDDAHNTVSIMSASSLTSHLLPDLMSAFKDYNPNVRYDLRYAGSNITAKGIYEGLADFGFIRGEPWTNCEKTRIRTEFAAVVSKEEIDLNTIPYLPRIDADLSESARLFINNWWQQTYDVSPNISMLVPSIDACIAMVRKGLGYSIIISSDVYEGIDGLHVYYLKNRDGNYVKRADYLIWNSDRSLTECAEMFKKFAVEYFKTKKWRINP